MLIKLLKYLRGYVKIKVEGYSPERLLNLCNVHKILLWDVEYKNSAYELYISIKDYKKLRPLVRKTRTKIILLEKHGLPFFLYKFRKRKLFFGGMFLCAVSVYVLSLFVWNIHIEGNVTQDTKEILEYMETLGVSHGTKKSEIVCEEIETKLRNQYPNMLWVSAEMSGTRMIIQIRENTDEDIVSGIERKENDPCSIVADTAGRVDSVIVRNGTPRIKEGDIVEAGQTLVDGYYEIKNDAGEIIRYEAVAADADITLLTVENYKDEISVEYMEKQFTEKKRLGVVFHIGEKSYEFNPKIPFEKYEAVNKNWEIHITENFYLPFSIETIWYLEYTPKTVKYEEKKLKELAEERFYDKYENILQKGVQIIEKDVKIDTNGKLCRVTGKVSLLVPVTKKVPAVIPELSDNTSLEGEN